MTILLKNKITLAILAAIMAVGVLAFALPGDAQAQLASPDTVCSFTGGDCNTDDDIEASIESLGRRVINILSIAVMGVSVIFIIVGGLKYITSNGNQEKVTSAKTTILYAVIGLLIVLFVQAILNFVVGAANTAVDGAGGGGTSLHRSTEVV